MDSPLNVGNVSTEEVAQRLATARQDMLDQHDAKPIRYYVITEGQITGLINILQEEVKFRLAKIGIEELLGLPETTDFFVVDGEEDKLCTENPAKYQKTQVPNL